MHRFRGPEKESALLKSQERPNEITVPARDLCLSGKGLPTDYAMLKRGFATDQHFLK